MTSHAPNEVIGDTRNQPAKPFNLPVFHWFFRRSKTLAGWISTLATIAGLLWGLDFMIERKLSDPAILRKIAAESSPALIFNANEAIIQNMGAAPFIADSGNGIHITKEADGWPRHIHIDFNRWLVNPPVLTSTYEVTVIIPKRAKGFSWDFDVSEVLQRGNVTSNLWTYRLEIVP